MTRFPLKLMKKKAAATTAIMLVRLPPPSHFTGAHYGLQTMFYWIAYQWLVYLYPSINICELLRSIHFRFAIYQGLCTWHQPTPRWFLSCSSCRVSFSSGALDLALRRFVQLTPFRVSERKVSEVCVKKSSVEMLSENWLLVFLLLNIFSMFLPISFKSSSSSSPPRHHHCFLQPHQ